MKSKYLRSRWLGTAMIFVMIFSVLGVVKNQVTPVSAQGPGGVTVVRDYKHDVSPPVRSIKPLPLPQRPERAESAPIQIGRNQDQADPVVQNFLSTATMPNALLNFDGIPFPGVNCNCAPPDTNGEVGLTQYVQIVNEGFQVFDKGTGASVFGPVGISTLWSGFGGVCQSNGDGDPVVLYDQIAKRWVISQFAGVSVPTDECIAVSTSSDATGSYNRYGFHLGTNFFDYPKLSVWPDGYYMSMNVFNSTGTAFLGPQPFAFDRTAMLAGNSATFITTGITGGSSEETYLPSDLDGSTLPPTGAPNTFVEWPNAGFYKVFHFHVDFAHPNNSTFTLFASVPAAGFTQLCPTTRNCVPQAGTGSKLDAIADRLMFRLAYRNFGDHEAVVTNYTVSSGGVAGIRWIELRNVTNGPVTKYQESTYQPDATWRWMGSAAMDGSGNLAIGFSASSSSINPQIRYAGRLASDPLSTLAQGETTLFAGTGSQSRTSNRWGDYSDLTVDPVDNCTFWYTTEYYATTSQFNWRTRIGSFKFADCGSTPTTGTLQGTVTDATTTAPISGATVTILGASTTTNASGFYQFTNVTPNTYSVTASASGYNSSTVNGVVVTAGNTTTQDFALTAIAPTTGTLQGTVRDATTTAFISGATVTILGGPSTTTDGSGFYQFTDVTPNTYSVTASATGYNSSTVNGVAVTAGNTTTQDFALTATASTGTIHVGDLDASTTVRNNNWNVTVTITVHDSGENPVANVTVTGNWTNSFNGSTNSCVTDSSGQCSVTTGNMKNNVSTTTFTVSGLTGAGYTYDSSLNHDPDGDSNGTSISAAR